MYWVCPLIEESEKLELQTAVALHAELTRDARRVAVDRSACLHGRMKPDEKAATMAAFVARRGPRAGRDDGHRSRRRRAERVADGDRARRALRPGAAAPAARPRRARRRESMCVLLFEEPLSDIAKQRLKVIYETTDGFEIARQDLLIRGPGEFLGARQSGVPLLRTKGMFINIICSNQHMRIFKQDLTEGLQFIQGIGCSCWIGGAINKKQLGFDCNCSIQLFWCDF